MPQVTHKISSFSRSEICELFKRARIRVRYSGVRILTAQKSQEFGRILIVTPRSSGNAPTRNLFKRRVRSVFCELHLATSSFDYIIITDKRGVSLSFAKLRQLLCSVSEGKPCSTGSLLESSN